MAIKPQNNGSSVEHSVRDPGAGVTYVVVADRALSRDECFKSIATYLGANAKPARGSVQRVAGPWATAA